MNGVLATLLPQGVLRGGTVVSCEGLAAVSLALAVASAPSIAGSWVAVVGLPTLGLAAAIEAGVVLERLVAVGAPDGAGRAGRVSGDAAWADVLAAAVDGFDVVLVGPEVRGVSSTTTRRLAARAVQRGSVMVTVDNAAFGADVRLEATDITWRGLGEGFGVALGRHAEVCASGRRVPGARRARLWLPAADGRPLVAVASTSESGTSESDAVGPDAVEPDAVEPATMPPAVWLRSAG